MAATALARTVLQANRLGWQAGLPGVAHGACSKVAPAAAEPRDLTEGEPRDPKATASEWPLYKRLLNPDTSVAITHAPRARVDLAEVQQALERQHGPVVLARWLVVRAMRPVALYTPISWYLRAAPDSVGHQGATEPTHAP